MKLSFMYSYNKDYMSEVSGLLACFTRPEMKVERVSYEVITPSVARAVFYNKINIQWIKED